MKRTRFIGVSLRALLFVAIASACAAAPAQSIRIDPSRTHWIWLTEPADGDTAYFRRRFELRSVRSAHVTITCDNVYELFVNGAYVGADREWTEAETYDISKHLRSGMNVVAVRGTNEGGPAALSAQISVETDSGETVVIGTDRSWRARQSLVPRWTEAGTDAGDWPPARDLGAFGSTPPWGSTVRVAQTLTALSESSERPERSGELVVLLGNTAIEREGRYGYLETALTILAPGEPLLFRNLGWSGDTVFGHARSYFGPPAEGFERLRRHLRRLRPDRVLVAYGAVAAFEGERGLEKFTQGYRVLLDSIAETGAKATLVTPLPHENLGIPLPSPRAYNEKLALYVRRVRSIGAERGLDVVDLHGPVRDHFRSSPQWRLTDNNVHLTAFGYWWLAPVLARVLGSADPTWRVSVARESVSPETIGTKLTNLRRSAEAVSFSLLDDRLPLPPPPASSPGSATALAPTRLLVVEGLRPGIYELRIDGVPVARHRAAVWGDGVRVARGPEFDQADALRRLVLTKNELYFHRWRPQNETYLFGFRKHEQGEHAVEIPMFDPLVDAKEVEIAALRKPRSHDYTLARVGEEANR